MLPLELTFPFLIFNLIQRSKLLIGSAKKRPTYTISSIEVNLGIFLACTPHMKPLFRYGAAVLSGHDPHAILLRRRRPSTSHSHWYHRLLPSSRHLSFASSRKRRTSSGQPAALLPANSARRTEGAWRAPVWSDQGRRSGGTAPGDGAEEEDTEKSLGLPLQGIEGSQVGGSGFESVFSVPSGEWESRSGYGKGIGRAR